MYSIKNQFTSQSAVPFIYTFHIHLSRKTTLNVCIIQTRTLGNEWLNDFHQEVQEETRTRTASPSLTLTPHSKVVFLLLNLFGLTHKSVGETLLPTWHKVSDLVAFLSLVARNVKGAMKI